MRMPKHVKKKLLYYNKIITLFFMLSFSFTDLLIVFTECYGYEPL